MQTIDFKKIKIRDGEKILDLGCGEARHAIAAAYHHPQTHVYYVDLDWQDLHEGKQRLENFFADQKIQTLGIQGNGLSLPFANDSFDHIICSEVLEHIPNFEGMLEEIDRILKPEGSLSVSVPRYWPEKICWWLSKEYHQVEGGHIRIFRQKVLTNTILHRHYTKVHKHHAHALHVPYWWLKCAFWQYGDDFWATRWYHRMLVWDLLKRPVITQTLDKILNPLMGKSVVLYFNKSKPL